ncbi:MAG: flagellar filament capping protein FliD [Epulopiscium sp.]|nr:flagellar filament capping protein FliD [Candidatus Epulonipiscium sp.]
MLISNKLRLTGFSGLDTESMVEQLMKAEYTKVDKLKQKLQVLKWQQEGYREMTNLLRGFKDKYLDILSKDNLISVSSFQAYSTSVKLDGADTNAVKVEASAGVAVGSHKIQVTQLATKEVWESTNSVSGDMVGNAGSIDWSKLSKGKTFDITLDGVKKTITLSGNYSGSTETEKVDALVAELQTKISDAFGSGNVTVSNEGNKIKFKATGHTFKISDTTNTYVSSLGFNNNQTNSITGSQLTFPLENLDGTFKISVNGTEKEINLSGSYETIDELATALNTEINDAFKADGGFDRDVVNVKVVDNKLKIVSYSTSDEIKLSKGSTNDILSKLGFSNGAKISKLEGAVDLTVSDIGKEFNIYVEGKSEPILIEIADDITDIDDLKTIINDKLNADNAGISVDVSEGGDKLIFVNSDGKEIKIANSTHKTADALGFKNGATNNLNLQDSLKNAFGITGTVNLEINGVSFTFKETDTVKSVMDKINNSSAGVTLSYSSVSDKFMLQSDKEGAANKIRISPEDNILIEKMFGQGGPDIKHATDAQFTLDGVPTQRSSNTFEVDGIKYTLNSVTNGEEVEITINSDPEKLVTKIKDFVDAYNDLISKINAKTSESRKKASKYEYYMPLTDEQKKEMSEKDIELWEEAAKAGLFKNDATLQKITDSMRRALYDAVEGVGIRIFDIGITTSTAYTDKGKLVIDEAKLRKAIEENPDQIAELFSKKSSISYDSSNRAQRYEQNGLSSRLLDIINDNIRTTVDSKGYRGILIEKAGIENSVTNVNNMMTKEIERQSNAIDELMDRLADKENRYFTMFARMESALQSMNNQSSYLTSMLSGWQ